MLKLSQMSDEQNRDRRARARVQTRVTERRSGDICE